MSTRDPGRRRRPRHPREEPTAAGGSSGTPGSRRSLSTAGELVERGGLAGGMVVLLYIVVGCGFWSLVGWGADQLLGTRWLVIVGALLGAAAGIYLGYLHMRQALNSGPSQEARPPEPQTSSGQGPSPRA